MRHLIHPFIAVLAILCSQCKSRNDRSELSVENGILSSDDEFSRPVQYLFGDPAKGYSLLAAKCTLSFVSDTTAFTAFHCVEGSDQVYVSTANGYEGRKHIKGSLAIYSPKDAPLKQKVFRSRRADIERLNAEFYNDFRCKEQGPENRKYASFKKRLDEAIELSNRAFDDFSSLDFAVVVFPHGTGRRFVQDRLYFGVSPKKPSRDSISAVKIIGIGNSSSHNQKPLSGMCFNTQMFFTGFGNKREGINRNFEFKGNLIMTTASHNRDGLDPGVEVTMLPGDSGSPLLACYDNECKTRDIIGVNTGFAKHDGFNHTITASIYSPAIVDTIKRAVECRSGRCASPFRGYYELFLGENHTFKPQTITDKIKSSNLSSSKLGRRFLHSTAINENKIILWGGKRPYKDPVYNDGAILDLQTGQWLSIAEVGISPRKGHGIAATKERITVWGGDDGLRHLSDGAYYDLSTARWDVLPPSPISPRAFLSAAADEEKFIVWGGRGKDEEHFNDGALFDFRSNTWSTLPDSPLSPRAFPSIVLADNKFIVWDGGKSDPEAPADGAYLDLASGEWTMLPSARFPSRWLFSITVANEKLIIWGGMDVHTGQERYDGAMLDLSSSTSGWQTIPESKTLVPNWGSVATIIDEKMVVWSSRKTRPTDQVVGIFDLQTMNWIH